MIATALINELSRLGIQLEARGDRLRFHPRSAVTPALAEQLRNHKAELLRHIQATEPLDRDGWPVGSIDINTLQPCHICTMAGHHRAMEVSLL